MNRIKPRMVVHSKTKDGYQSDWIVHYGSVVRRQDYNSWKNMGIDWYGMVKLYLNTLASINVSCFSWGASHNNYLQIKKYTH
jgi:hypothetical protein